MRFTSEIRPVILCGGDGTRLAPLPAKQFLALAGTRSLVQQTVDRVSRYGAATVIANEAHREQAQAQLSGASLIFERERQGTAAAAALASESGDGLVLLLPCDHVIADEEAFHRAVVEAVPPAQAGKIVIFGVPATSPETGYGYIVPDGTNVTRFVEKPSREDAAALIAQGALWNAGIFLFRADVMRGELAKFGNTGSLDRTVMEKTDRAAVVRVEMGWRDIGSWEALWRHTRTRKDADTVVRPWGRYTGFAQGPGFQLKEIVVNPHARISLRKHHRRREHWIVMAGTARVTRDDAVFDVEAGGTADIPLGAVHRLENPGDTPLHIVEVQFGDYLGEDDIERYADDYGRA